MPFRGGVDSKECGIDTVAAVRSSQVRIFSVIARTCHGRCPQTVIATPGRTR
jgi:hypothetical protein